MINYEGILLCDKPFGLSSHDVIDILRETIGQRKIGHTGTLDPRAVGLMVICLGRATKIARFIADVDKTYEVDITLGLRSPTYDAEGIDARTQPEEIPDLNEDDFRDILAGFKGISLQKVPPYSAIKINGERLYKSARRGENIATPEREIVINDIELLEFDLPRVSFRVSCSKGTYIRALANDIGEKIGCGAVVSRLVRTQVGRFRLDDAMTLNEIKYRRQAKTLKRFIRPIESILPFPSIRVNAEFSPLILSGKSPCLKDIINIDGDFNPEELISLRNSEGRIMAVGKSAISSSKLDDYKGKSFFTYVRVLN